MSFTKISALALFALSASAQLYPRATNATTIAVTSVATSIAPAATPLNPASLEVGGELWVYEGCAASATGFSGFTQVSVTLNSAEACVAACTATNAEYAGLFGASCFCSSTTDSGIAILPDGDCSFVCPGNTAESCGGSSIGGLSFGKRQATVPGGALLTLYKVVQVIPVGVYTIVYSTEYVSVCPTGLTTVPYSTTLTSTHCGCTNITPAPTVPLITTIGSCGCGVGGAQQTYTVTVPAAVYPTPAGAPAGAPAVTAVGPVAGVPAAQAVSTVTVAACPGSNGGAPVAPVSPVAANPAAVNGGSGNNNGGSCNGECNNGGGAISNGAGTAPTATGTAPLAAFTGAASRKAAGGLVAVIAVGAFALL